MGRQIEVINCVICERTGDGVLVGRCWMTLNGGVCPRHGDISKAIKHYKSTGELTREKL